MTDLNQMKQDIELILRTEQAAVIAGRADLEAKKKRRQEISKLLDEMYEAYDQIGGQFRDLPELPDERIMDWADAVLAMRNLAIVVLDTTSVQEDSDIIGIHAIGGNGLSILDLVMAPLRQHTANTLYTGISEDEIAMAPTLADAWEQITRALKGCYFVSFNLKFVRQHLTDNIAHYGLSNMPFLGDCLMDKAKSYFGVGSYGYGSGLKLPEACLRIGHQLPTNPPLAQDRATGCLALLKAMANGITSAPLPPAEPITADTDLSEIDDHPF